MSENADTTAGPQDAERLGEDGGFVGRPHTAYRTALSSEALELGARRDRQLSRRPP